MSARPANGIARAFAVAALLGALVGCGGPSDNGASDIDTAPDSESPTTATPDPTAKPDSEPPTAATPDPTAEPDSEPPTAATPDPTAETTATAPPTIVPSTPTPEPSFPESTGRTVIDDRGVEVRIESIERIIPLDGDVAEIIFALGMGDHVVATDLSATYPPEADALPQIGYQRALTTEPILEFEPTLLIGTDIAGPPETLADLERIGVPLVIVPTEPTAQGGQDKIIAVAEALGVPERGIELTDRLRDEIAAALAEVEPVDVPPRIAALYIRGTSARLVLGASFNTDWLIDAIGGANIADELGIEDSATLTDEAILVAAPDVLIVPASGLESVNGIEGLLDAIPALERTPAGRNRAVLSYDDQLLLGNGPRTGALLTTMISDLADLISQSAAE